MINNFFKNFFERFKAFETSPTGKRVMRWLSILLTAVIAGYLVFKLTLLGWDKVWQSLPRTGWFYLLLLVMFFSLPLFQVLIYGVAWRVNVKPGELFLALLNKRVLDKDVLGYSGEMYLYFWARKYVKKSDREILHVLKDNIILSSAASTLVAAVLLLLFFVLGRVKLPQEWMRPGFIRVGVPVFCGVLIIGLIITFRKRIFFLKSREILAVFGLHICRLLFVQGLQVVQWAVVMPEIPIFNWMTLLAVQIIITRIPLIPSRDLVFMGAGIEMSEFIHVSTPSMAGMLLASSVLNKVLNLFIFVAVFFSTRKRRRDGVL